MHEAEGRSVAPTNPNRSNRRLELLLLLDRTLRLPSLQRLLFRIPLVGFPLLRRLCLEMSAFGREVGGSRGVPWL